MGSLNILSIFISTKQYTVRLVKSYRASLRSFLHPCISKKSRAHKDVSRINKDESNVQDIISVLQQIFIHSFSEEPLLLISTGIAVEQDAAGDMY